VHGLRQDVGLGAEVAGGEASAEHARGVHGGGPPPRPARHRGRPTVCKHVSGATQDMCNRLRPVHGRNRDSLKLASFHVKLSLTANKKNTLYALQPYAGTSENSTSHHGHHLSRKGTLRRRFAAQRGNVPAPHTPPNRRLGALSCWSTSCSLHSLSPTQLCPPLCVHMQSVAARQNLAGRTAAPLAARSMAATRFFSAQAKPYDVLVFDGEHRCLAPVCLRRHAPRHIHGAPRAGGAAESATLCTSALGLIGVLTRAFASKRCPACACDNAFTHDT